MYAAIVYENRFSGIYKRINVLEWKKLIGRNPCDSSDYSSYSNLATQWHCRNPEDLILGSAVAKDLYNGKRI
jgi:hypothetical protein